MHARHERAVVRHRLLHRHVRVVQRAAVHVHLQAKRQGEGLARRTPERQQRGRRIYAWLAPSRSGAWIRSGTGLAASGTRKSFPTSSWLATDFLTQRTTRGVAQGRTTVTRARAERRPSAPTPTISQSSATTLVSALRPRVAPPRQRERDTPWGGVAAAGGVPTHDWAVPRHTLAGSRIAYNVWQGASGEGGSSLSVCGRRGGGGCCTRMSLGRALDPGRRSAAVTVTGATATLEASLVPLVRLRSTGGRAPVVDVGATAPSLGFVLRPSTIGRLPAPMFCSAPSPTVSKLGFAEGPWATVRIRSDSCGCSGRLAVQ